VQLFRARPRSRDSNDERFSCSRTTRSTSSASARTRSSVTRRGSPTARRSRRRSRIRCRRTWNRAGTS